MSQDDASDVAPLRNEKTDVGKDQLDARQVFFIGERYTDVDDQPGAAPLVAKPVQRQVHPDLADAAKRREHKLAWCGHGPYALTSAGSTSPAVMVSVLPSTLRSTKRPA